MRSQDTYKAMDRAGWLGWPLATSCVPFESIKRPLPALKATKTFRAFSRGERAPKIPATGGEDAFLRFCEPSPLPIRIFRDAGLLVNMRNDHGYGQVAFIEDVNPANFHPSATRLAEPNQQQSAIIQWKESSDACNGLNAQERAALRKLAPIAHRLAQAQQKRLNDLKKEAISKWGDPEAAWNFLIQSFATWGGSEPASKLAALPDLAASISFSNLKAAAPIERSKRVRALVQLCGMRWPEKKVHCVLTAFDRMDAMGGPESAKRHIESLPTFVEKMQFLESFEGIGKKYSRNFFMDFYDPQFRDSIAIDSRIKRILETADIPFEPYDYAEGFLLRVARAAGISGWDLDRLMYLNQDEFLQT